MAKEQQQHGPDVQDMQAKIGGLALEDDFLVAALGRIYATDQTPGE